MILSNDKKSFSFGRGMVEGRCLVLQIVKSGSGLRLILKPAITLLDYGFQVYLTTTVSEACDYNIKIVIVVSPELN